MFVNVIKKSFVYVTSYHCCLWDDKRTPCRALVYMHTQLLHVALQRKFFYLILKLNHHSCDVDKKKHTTEFHLIVVYFSCVYVCIQRIWLGTIRRNIIKQYMTMKKKSWLYLLRWQTIDLTLWVCRANDDRMLMNVNWIIFCQKKNSFPESYIVSQFDAVPRKNDTTRAK